MLNRLRFYEWKEPAGPRGRPKSTNPFLLQVDGTVAMILPCGRRAIVDLHDFWRVADLKWFSVQLPGDRVYVKANEPGGWHKVPLQRFVLQAGNSDPIVDHWDGDPLNNRRSNLRFATQVQNRANARAQRRKTTTQYKGVYLVASRKYFKYQARIVSGGKMKYLGGFMYPADAARAYDAAARRLHGEFARLNNPEARRPLYDNHRRGGWD